MLPHIFRMLLRKSSKAALRMQQKKRTLEFILVGTKYNRTEKYGINKWYEDAHLV